MAFPIYSSHYCCRPEKDASVLSKGDLTSLFIDGALITGSSLIMGLILSGVINIGIPVGVGTLGNGLLCGGFAMVAGLLLLDLLILVIRFNDVSAEDMSLTIDSLGWREPESSIGFFT